MRIGERLPDHGDHWDHTPEYVGNGDPGRSHRGSVLLDDPGGGRIGRHPTGVHDTHGMGVDPASAAPDSGHVARIDPCRFGDLDPQAGLLPNLTDDGVSRRLSVVDSPAGQRPQLGRGDTRCQPGQQDHPVPHDHGVGRDSLHLRKVRGAFGHFGDLCHRDSLRKWIGEHPRIGRDAPGQVERPGTNTRSRSDWVTVAARPTSAVEIRQLYGHGRRRSRSARPSNQQTRRSSIASGVAC